MKSALPGPDAVLRVRRLGGVAALPGLRRERAVELSALNDAQRAHLIELIAQCHGLAARAGQPPGAGDQRYYAISWDNLPPLHIGEQAAPEALVRLWKDGTAP